MQPSSSSKRHCESVEEGSREDVSAGENDRGYELEEDGVDGWDKKYGRLEGGHLCEALRESLTIRNARWRVKILNCVCGELW